MNTKDWYRVLSTALHKEGFTQVDIQQVYKIEMEARTFFDFDEIIPDFLKLQNIERDSQKNVYYWHSHSSEAKCPCCGTISHKECKDYFTLLKNIPQINIKMPTGIKNQRHHLGIKMLLNSYKNVELPLYSK